jgi:hypothetical protein
MAVKGKMMSVKLNDFIHRMKSAGVFPKNIEMANWNNWHLVSCFDEKPREYISDSAYMGIDKSPEIAIFKSLTEYCERTLSRRSNDSITKITARSDGFAAYPVLFENHTLAKINAQENALHESIERLMWSTWWDSQHVAFEVVDPLKGIFGADINALVNEFSLKSVRQINVHDASGRYCLSILLAEKGDGGFVTGGACSQVQNEEKRLTPAFGELLRHLFVVEKMLSAKSLGETFYEKRLFGFGSGVWSSLVKKRLSTRGPMPIQLPDLVVNQEIIHEAMDLVKIHRCLFLNQPVFMGGAIERLCI